MDPTTSKSDLVKRLMVQQFRQRLRSKKVSETIDMWTKQPGVPASIKFEFVLNDATTQTLKDPTRAGGLKDERID